MNLTIVDLAPRTEPALVSPLTADFCSDFAARLMHWYRINARVLPWRGIQDPYQTWLSEIMLQQTRVAAVLEHFARFIERFPTMVALALASEADVLAAWSGLGYYRRARMLHRTALLLVQEHGAALPRTAAELRRLPGIGSYTSAAIASIAFQERVAVVDGNVERVLLRILGQPETPGAAAADLLNTVAQSLVPEVSPGDHNQAMMELGATVCLPRNPRCDACPVYSLCLTRGEHSTPARTPMQSRRAAYALTTRKVRGGISLEVLMQHRPADASLMPGMLELPPVAPSDAAAETASSGEPVLTLEQEPVLRVRHAITGTNYYVEVLALPTQRAVRTRALRDADWEWILIRDLVNRPLTGLARKVLQRLRLMPTSAAPIVQVPLLIGRARRAATGADEPPPNQTRVDATRPAQTHPIHGAAQQPAAPDGKEKPMATERSSSAVWHGGLKDGEGTVSTSSGVLKNQSYTFVSRFETGAGTNPEELIAAAHAGCFSMALSAELEKAGSKADEVATTAAVVLEFVNGAPTVTKIHLKTDATVPNLDDEKFQQIAKGAKENCPISRLLAVAEITLDATLKA